MAALVRGNSSIILLRIPRPGIPPREAPKEQPALVALPAVPVHRATVPLLQLAAPAAMAGRVDRATMVPREAMADWVPGVVRVVREAPAVQGAPGARAVMAETKMSMLLTPQAQSAQ